LSALIAAAAFTIGPILSDSMALTIGHIFE
jgi:hypothetical protein